MKHARTHVLARAERARALRAREHVREYARVSSTHAKINTWFFYAKETIVSAGLLMALTRAGVFKE